MSVEKQENVRIVALTNKLPKRWGVYFSTCVTLNVAQAQGVRSAGHQENACSQKTRNSKKTWTD